jgi:hypothetical protein
MGLQFLKSFKPDEDALLRQIAAHIDDATLEHIANEDSVGGDLRHARFIDALRKIRDGGPLKKQSDFPSWERFADQDVTELLKFGSFSEPDAKRNRDWKWTGTRGHWPRAFSCATLLRSYGDNEVRNSAAGNYDYAIMQLVESIRRLDAGLEPQAMAALAWFIIRLSDDDCVGLDPGRDQIVFAGVGILSLAVNSKNMISYDTVTELIDWLIAEEKRAFDERGKSVGNFPNHWLFRTTFFDTLREKWMAIGAELAAFKVSGLCGDAVRAIGQKVAGQTLM